MKRYGKKNDPWDDGDTLSNCNNASKSSDQRSDGKGALRSSKQKRALRTIMNKRKRAELKREMSQSADIMCSFYCGAATEYDEKNNETYCKDCGKCV